MVANQREGPRTWGRKGASIGKFLLPTPNEAKKAGERQEREEKAGERERGRIPGRTGTHRNV